MNAGIAFVIVVQNGYFNTLINMKSIQYKSPEIEIIEMQLEQAVLNSSFTGEGINEWEDM